ncbi:MAG: translation initiation factor IF-3 [Desulfobulbaceae bacterium]|nr:translation initiation factor IF-3 [Desulfobulbaceae bacterium]
MASKNLRINERIRVPKVRLIDDENNQLGIVSTLEAMDKARDAGVDLVEVAPSSDPPVCRLMDYGKWKYDQKKKEHKSKVKQHNVVLKEVRLRPKIDQHDRDFKLKQARGFLEKGSKVQFTMLFRGREMMHLDRAVEVFDYIAQEFAELGKIESPARRQGRRMTMVMAPSAVK